MLYKNKKMHDKSSTSRTVQENTRGNKIKGLIGSLRKLSTDSNINVSDRKNIQLVRDILKDGEDRLDIVNAVMEVVPQSYM